MRSAPTDHQPSFNAESPVGEDPDDIGSTAEFLVQPLLGVV